MSAALSRALFAVSITRMAMIGCAGQWFDGIMTP
jgi:hypothetical protein